MCGIIYFENLLAPSVSKSVKKRYLKQKHRGSRGFGFVAFSLKDKGKLARFFRDETEAGILKALDSIESDAVLFHHRLPTSTPNLKECAHPIFISNPRNAYDYYVVHNGVISNPLELKAKHERLGYLYSTECVIEKVTRTRDTIYTEIDGVEFNDSEALGIELVEVIEDHKKTVEARGTIAFIVLQADRETGDILRMYYGRNLGNPLMVDRDKDQFSLRSEGGGRQVEAHMLYMRHLESKEEGVMPLNFPANYDYPHARTQPTKEDRRAIFDAREEAKETGTTPRELLPMKADIIHEYGNRFDEAEDAVPTPFLEEMGFIAPARMSQYWNGVNVYNNPTKDLIVEADMSLDEILEWIDKDLIKLEAIEAFLKESKDNSLLDELGECYEIMAELEDRKVEIETVLEGVEGELKDSPEEAGSRQFGFRFIDEDDARQHTPQDHRNIIS